MNTSPITNLEKQQNYREQMGRLAKAMKEQFYLEAFFIEYAVLEDRTTALLRYTNDFNAEKQNTLSKKLTKLKSMQRVEHSTLARYLSNEIISDMQGWIRNRNTIVHALLNQTLTTDELKAFAEKGQALAKTLASKSTAYKRYLKSHDSLLDFDITLTEEEAKIFTEISPKGFLSQIDAAYICANHITELTIPDCCNRNKEQPFSRPDNDHVIKNRTASSRS